MASIVQSNLWSCDIKFLEAKKLLASVIFPGTLNRFVLLCSVS